MSTPDRPTTPDQAAALLSALCDRAVGRLSDDPAVQEYRTPDAYVAAPIPALRLLLDAYARDHEAA